MGLHHEAVGVDAEERMSGRFVSVDRDTPYLYLNRWEVLRQEAHTASRAVPQPPAERNYLL